MSNRSKRLMPLKDAIPMTRETLDRFKEALRIVRTGRGSNGTSYNSLGTLNQAAWLGENAGCMIAEIERLQSLVGQSKGTK